MKTLTQELEEFEKKFEVVWTNSASRERFLTDAGKEVSTINGAWRNRHRGTLIPSIEDYLIMKIKSSDYARPKSYTEKYVSPYPKRNADTIAKHKIEMHKVILHELDKHHYVFKTESAKAKVIEVLAENFLAVDGPNGIVYHKVHDNSIPSTDTWDINTLIQKVGVSKYIDQDQTDIAQKFYESDLMEKAIRITGKDPYKHTLNEGGTFLTLLDKLRKIDHGMIVGKKLNVDISDLQNEFKKKALVETGKDEVSMTLQERNLLNNRIAFETSQVNSLDGIGKIVNEIESDPEPQAWEF